MKSALLHYWLVRDRGGEKVLAALNRLLPAADIYTHAYRPLPGFGFDRSRVHESFIGRLPFAHVHPERYLPLMPMASRRFDLSAYDLIVSSESGPIKGIVKRPDQRHVCYCHTPMRYVWDMYDEYYAFAGIAGRLAMRLFTPGLRRADLKSAECVDEFIANSRFVAERIRRIYGREAKVVHPPVDVDFFSAPSERIGVVPETPYYLWAGAFTCYKRIDLAREACNRMGRQLVVAHGECTREELRALYAGAKALLFPGVEDFGIVPVESQAAGTPVIAYGRGGALETVREGETGLFFREQTVESLCGAIEEFEGRAWDPAACRANAERFGIERFSREMAAVLNRTTDRTGR